jgi:hypothetical protein
MNTAVEFGSGNVVPVNPGDPNSLVIVEGTFKIPMRLIVESAQTGKPLVVVVPIVGVGWDLQISATLTEEVAPPVSEPPVAEAPSQS